MSIPVLALSATGKLTVDQPVPMIYAPPGNGPLMVRLPYRNRYNRPWLKEEAGIRSPQLRDDGKWQLPRSSLLRVIVASVRQYRHAVVVRGMLSQGKCTVLCQQAEGPECECCCGGEFHGGSSQDWINPVGYLLISKTSELSTHAVIYGPGSPFTEIFEGNSE